MSARHRRARTKSKKELSNYLNDTAPVTTIQNKTAISVISDYPRQPCKLDYVDWEPYRNGKVLSTGKCIKLELKKAA